jgi:hypothetical protein
MVYVKVGGDPRACFSVSRPISQCELRAASYLASAIGAATGRTPDLRSDMEARSQLDLDFISFGGPLSNFKTADCQVNGANRIARLEQAATTRVQDLDANAPLPFSLDSEFDYGLILKVRPCQFPQRTSLACAGFGEWGTSGAAWYLANRWNEIRKKTKAKCFALVVRVRHQQDQSAEPVWLMPGQE